MTPGPQDAEEQQEIPPSFLAEIQETLLTKKSLKACLERHFHHPSV